jgi:hypothetical protein
VEDMPMERKIQLNLYVPEEYRNILQRLAAERMLKNPKRSVTASKIAVEIIGEYLDKFNAVDGTKKGSAIKERIIK